MPKPSQIFALAFKKTFAHSRAMHAHGTLIGMTRKKSFEVFVIGASIDVQFSPILIVTDYSPSALTVNS